VRNNPLTFIDPTGHWECSFDPDECAFLQNNNPGGGITITLSNTSSNSTSSGGGDNSNSGSSGGGGSNPSSGGDPNSNNGTQAGYYCETGYGCWKDGVTDISGTLYDPAVYISLTVGGWASGLLDATFWGAATACVSNVVCRWVTGMAGGGGVTARYIWDIRTGQYRDTTTGRFVASGNLPWPRNSGFASGPINRTLPIGTLIDRYGKLSGQYAGIPGTSISARGMAPGSENMPYTMLRVIKPITIPSGPAAGVSAFDATGGGMQYYFPGGIQSYVDKFLEVVK
jgi:hypothetical protein